MELWSMYDESQKFNTSKICGPINGAYVAGPQLDIYLIIITVLSAMSCSCCTFRQWIIVTAEQQLLSANTFYTFLQKEGH